MNKFIFLASLCFLICSARLFSQTTTTIINSTQTGIDLYDQHKYKEAIVEFNKSIKSDPKDGKALYYRGLAKMHDGQKGFCKDFEESLSLGYCTRSDIYYYGCETVPKK